MSQLFITDSTRHLFAIDGGNTEKPLKRTRPALFHPTQTVVAVGSEKGVRQYDVIRREPFACSEWEPA